MAAIIWIYDLLGVQACALRDITGLEIEDRLQDAETLKFSMRADDPRAVFVEADAIVRCEHRKWRVTLAQQTRGAGGDSMIDVTAEGLWTDLGKRVRVGSYSVLGQTLLDGLTLILAKSGWTVGSTPASLTLYSLDMADPTILGVLRQWAAITGTEIVFDTENLTVSLVAAQGSNHGVGFRYGRNLTEITRKVEPPYATRLWAYGANDLNISNVNPSGFDFIEDYSWYTGLGLTLDEARERYTKDQVWTDERYLVALNLYDAAVARLADLASARISYECKILDLYSLALSAAPVAIGDTVHVFDGVFDLDLATRVVRIVRRPNEPWADEIELSFLQKTSSETLERVSTRTPTYGALSLLVDQNDATMTLAAVNQSWATIALTVTGETTAAVGAAFAGTSTGTGTIRFEFAVDGIAQGPVQQDVVFTSGQRVNFAWPTFGAGLTEGSHQLEWRSRIVAGSGTIAVDAGDGRAWVLAAGAVGIGASTSPNQQIAESIPYDERTVGQSGTVTLLVSGSPVSTVNF